MVLLSTGPHPDSLGKGNLQFDHLLFTHGTCTLILFLSKY